MARHGGQKDYRRAGGEGYYLIPNKRVIIEMTMDDVVDAICQRFCIKRDSIWKIEKGCNTFYPHNSEHMEGEVVITTWRRELKKRRRRKVKRNEEGTAV